MGRAIEQQVREQIDKGEIDPNIVEKVNEEVVKQVVEQAIKEHANDIQELKKKTSELVTKITNSVLSKLENIEN